MDFLTKRTTKLNAMIAKVVLIETQVTSLLHTKKETEQAIHEGKKQLVLGLAERHGLMQSSPDAIVAALKAINQPILTPPSNIANTANDGPAIETKAEPSHASHHVIVKFGNHHGEKRAQLESAGLRWNGKLGEWHGEVDEVTLRRLNNMLSGKLTSKALSGQSTAKPSDDPPRDREAVDSGLSRDADYLPKAGDVATSPDFAEVESSGPAMHADLPAEPVQKPPTADEPRDGANPARTTARPLPPRISQRFLPR